MTPVSTAISKIQSALADGPHVELHRLEQVCAVWRIDLSSVDLSRKKTVAAQFEIKLYELAGDTLKVCFGVQRPKEFKTELDSKKWILVLKREKKDK